MKTSIFSPLLLLIPLILTSCFQAASKPYTYTPKSPTTPWKPSNQLRPIPPCYLLNPTDFCEKANDNETQSLGLSDIIQIALINSNLLKESFSETRIAAAKYGQSLSPFFPELTGEYYYQAIRMGNFFGANSIFINQYSQWGPYLSMNWLLFDSGTTSAESEAMREALLEANWLHNREIQNVIRTATNNYYVYHGYKEQVIANEANLENALNVLESTKSKNHLGIADVSEVLQAETQVAKRELLLLQSEENMEDAKTALIAELGIAANTPLNFKNPTQEIDRKLTLPPLECYITEAYMYRPDLFAAYSKVQSDAASVQVTRSQQWYNLNLQSSLGTNRFHNGQTDGLDYSVLLNLSLPLFKGFDYINQIREAAAKLSFSKAEMRQLEIDITKGVTTSYQNLDFSTDKVNISIYYVEVAELAYRATFAKYKAGTVDYVTLVNSLTELADARNALAQSKKDWYTSLTDLAYSTGILCK